MAIVLGIVGTAQTTSGTSEVQFFQAPVGLAAGSTLCVRVSTADAIVRIPELHGTTAGVGAKIPAGEKEYFRVNSTITSAFISVASGTATVDWFLVARAKDGM